MEKDQIGGSLDSLNYSKNILCSMRIKMMHKKIDNIFENIIIFKVQVNSNFMVHRINDLNISYLYRYCTGQKRCTGNSCTTYTRFT